MEHERRFINPIKVFGMKDISVIKDAIFFSKVFHSFIKTPIHNPLTNSYTSLSVKMEVKMNQLNSI